MRWCWSALLVSLMSFQAFASQLVIRVADQQPVVLTHEEITTQLEAHSFATSLPWFEGKKEFTGFTITDLLAHLGIDDAFSVSFIALNDYAASSQIKDIKQYQPIVAYQIDNKNMKVRNKGPYWLVFNLDQYPEIDNAVFHSQMVWQIDEILIHRTQDVAAQ
ncbi:hypothetical protein L1D52_05805 [Vibrio brasiliensis]|uniref:hypothetical protein n=1 Tax=Vibrio brasiliensis TaxID=170652 RepID=UPI001EFD2D0C|nr:hypothetical protein [Vibrio brasiliensis]MCG9781863.1 hypothetical protein [Vibrio brasiliensis]